MKDWIPVLTMFGSGLFGAAIAWITAHYTIKRINHEDIVKWNRSRVEKTEDVYSQLIACISKMLNNAQLLQSNKDIGFEDLHSKVELLGAKAVVEALNEWTDKFNEWVDNYVSGSPKKIGDTNYAIIASYQSPYREKSKDLYPGLYEAGRNLIIQCRKHLEQLYAQGT